MSELKHVQVWNTTVAEKPVRVATVEHGPRKKSMCEGCPSPCCQGMFYPVLNAAEFKERKFPTKFLPVPDWLTEHTSRAQMIATLAMFEGGCKYFDHETARCTAWPNCPEGCLAYDCRDDTRPEIAEFARAREATWQGQ